MALGGTREQSGHEPAETACIVPHYTGILIMKNGDTDSACSA